MPARAISIMTNAVEAHYDLFAQREWERLERHRMEFAVTCLVLDEFLPPPPGRILDVGGGPGRYTIHLTRKHYQVTLVDLSQASLDLALEKATNEGMYLPPPLQADATALPAGFDGLFDAVLLMGPLYHLMAVEDRLAALREAYRVLRPGGLLFAAFITRFAPLRDIATHSPQWVLEHPNRYHRLLHDGQNPAGENSAFPDAYFAHPDEIAPLIAAAGFHLEAIQGCEGLLAGHEEAVNGSEGELWAAWVELNYVVGRDPSLRGAADHLLAVATKPAPPPDPA